MTTIRKCDYRTDKQTDTQTDGQTDARHSDPYSGIARRRRGGGKPFSPKSEKQKKKIKALKKLRANVSDSFKVLMIENSSIEIGCIYFFQITINVFSSSNQQLTILGTLK